ncbi:MAG: hypothetical protein CVU39_25940 [Chloroflexi bacterium HGW-Chloroflexi-10]|nr:MAG: hypothetical protein CVU39_25940 [Chloroflexi bacterium HGW-Chloroflexi-10]
MFSALRKMVVSFGFVFCLLTAMFAAVFVFNSSATIHKVSASDDPALAAGFGTAAIDGVIDPTEWAAADVASIQMIFSSPYLNGSLYVMQDSTNLYLGFTVDDDELSTFYWYGFYGDTLEINFDDNNSGTLYDVGENKVILGAYDPWIEDLHFIGTTGTAAFDPQQDGEGRATRVGDKNHYELSFPLCSGDIHDFCLEPGDVAGLQLQYNDIYADGAAPLAYLFPDDQLDALVTITLMEYPSIFLPLIVR